MKKFLRDNLVQFVVAICSLTMHIPLAFGADAKTTTLNIPHAAFAYYYDAMGTPKYAETLAGLKERTIRIPYTGTVPKMPETGDFPSSGPKRIQINTGSEKVTVAVYYGVECGSGNIVMLAMEDVSDETREITQWRRADEPRGPDCRCQCKSCIGGCCCPPPCQ